jgi:Pyruvate/2-oxoacid:ferredoxin oxidoreductase delta subunit
MTSKRYVLHFPRTIVDKPILSGLFRDYELSFNILKASIDEDGGSLTLDLIGKDNDIHRGVDFLKKLGVDVKPLSQKIKYHEDKCIHCGACVIFCPTRALDINRDTMEIKFNEQKCVVCGVCIKYCPPRAMELSEN